MGEPFIFKTRIRFIDTDASGRIHYTSMFRYFESAEIEFLRTLNFTYGDRNEHHYPRVHVECDFLLAIVHDDEIEIDVVIAKLGRSSIRFEFSTRKGGALAARGVVVIACMDRRTQRAVEIPAAVREKLAAAMG